MKNLKLKGSIRSEFGKKASKDIRKNGDVPCVLYGGEKIVHFLVKDTDLNALIYTPNIYSVELNIDNVNYIAKLQESQFHPVKDNILHLDFLQIFPEKPISMNVPVKLVGHSEGVKAGGRLMQVLRTIKVKGLYTDIPDFLEIDTTPLTIGKSLQVSKLSYDKLQILTSKQAIVCAVKATRAVVETPVAAPAAAAEPAAE